MDNKVPLLNFEQIEELINMVRTIQLDNTKKLETILSETVEIEQTTILTLYNMVVQEWKKKQTVIDNLCHFTLTMMATVEMLWQQQHDQSDKLNSAEVYIQHLNNNIYELGDQNQAYKQKIKEAQIKISTIAEEKDRIQELYRSQSCIAFNQEDQNQAYRTLNKHCSACSEIHIKSQDQNVQNLHKSQKFIEQRLQELSEVLSQKKLIEEQYNQLKEQHELTRMQLELAEMAIQDALAYKHSYLSTMSNVNQMQSLKSHSIFENNQVYQAQKMLEDIKNLDSRNLASQIPISQTLEMQSILRQPGFLQNSQLSNQSDLSLIKLGKEQITTTHDSPFKKKEDIVQKPVIQLGQESKLQLKNNTQQMSSSQDISTNLDQAKNNLSKKQSNFTNYKQEDPLKVVKSLKILGTSSTSKETKKSKQKEQDQSQSKLGKFYNMISQKVVTNRIKKR